MIVGATMVAACAVGLAATPAAHEGARNLLAAGAVIGWLVMAAEALWH